MLGTSMKCGLGRKVHFRTAIGWTSSEYGRGSFGNARAHTVSAGAILKLMNFSTNAYKDATRSTKAFRHAVQFRDPDGSADGTGNLIRSPLLPPSKTWASQRSSATVDLLSSSNWPFKQEGKNTEPLTQESGRARRSGDL